MLPDDLENKIINQDWKGLQIKAVEEGRGVFACKDFKKNEPICNYGGIFMNHDCAKKNFLPYDEKCDYLLEINQKFEGEYTKFYLNHDNSTETFGKYLNHSKIHPNLSFKIYSTKNNKLDVIFIAKKKILAGSQLLWDYGKSYSGVNACVKSCSKCP